MAQAERRRENPRTQRAPQAGSSRTRTPSSRATASPSSPAPPPPPSALIRARALPPGQSAAAVPLLLEALRTPLLAPVYALEIHERLALVLEALGLPLLSASTELRLLAGDATPAQRIAAFSRVAPVLQASRLDFLIIPGAGALDPGAFSDLQQGDAAWYRGLERLRADAPTEAIAALVLVPATHPTFVLARLELANAFMGLRRPALGVAVLLDLWKTHGDLLQANPIQLETVRLNLARARYALGQVAEAAALYESMPRSSRHWLKAQEELAWTYYRWFAQEQDLEALNRALGVLQSLNSPWFSERFLPEPALLEAQILYQLCLFVEGSRKLKRFLLEETPQRDALKAALADRLSTPEAVLTLARGLKQAETDGLPADAALLPPRWHAILTAAPELEPLERLEVQVAQERERLDRMAGTLPESTQALLRERLDSLLHAQRRQTGDALRTRLEQLLASLNGWLGDAQLFTLNLITAEKELYEAAAAGRLPESLPSRLRSRPPSWPRHARVWPYEGEYWSDELGYYRARAEPRCPE